MRELAPCPGSAAQAQIESLCLNDVAVYDCNVEFVTELDEGVDNTGSLRVEDRVSQQHLDFIVAEVKGCGHQSCYLVPPRPREEDAVAWMKTKPDDLSRGLRHPIFEAATLQHASNLSRPLSSQVNPISKWHVVEWGYCRV